VKPPADPRVRAFLDALADAVAIAAVREIREEEARAKGVAGGAEASPAAQGGEEQGGS
jgi:hypothetical protein